jgi:hypothetical protein
MFYGQLQYILECSLPRSSKLGLPKSKRFLLAVIVPCITEGKDATCELTTYGRVSTSIVIDLQTIGCVVGRVKRGKTWGIVDRSGELARTVFVDQQDIDEDEWL